MAIDLNLLIGNLAHPANKDRPWMTARVLAKKIGLQESGKYMVEECLLDYFKQMTDKDKTPLIRYANLPGKHSLEVLWGHTDLVGNRNLLGIKKTDVADDTLEVDADIKTADVFISHSFKDYDDVISIAKLLQGKNIRPWLAETHIGQGEHINEEVISAIEETRCFAIYLSDNSLSSKWTGKEYGYACSKNIKIIVIADCRCNVVRILLERRLRGEKPPTEMILSGDAAHFFTDLLNDNKGITEFVIYPANYWPQFEYSGRTKKIFSIDQMAGLIK